MADTNPMGDGTTQPPVPPQYSPPPAPTAPPSYTPAPSPQFGGAPSPLPPGYGETPQQVAFDPEPEKPGNLLVGILAGLGLGLLVALVYAAIAVFAEREILYLAILIGLAVAFGFTKFGRTTGIVPGLLAAVISLLMFFVAVILAFTGAIAKEFNESFARAFSFVTEDLGTVVSLYFEEPMSYLFVAATVIIAFVVAAGIAGKKVGK